MLRVPIHLNKHTMFAILTVALPLALAFQLRAQDPNPGFVPGAGNGGGNGALPQDYVIMASEGIGRAMVAQRDEVRSARVMLLGVIADLSHYFDQKPAVTNAFAEKDERTAGAAFRASLKGKGVKGTIFTSVGAKGGTAAIIYDADDAPPHNFARLAAALPTVREVQWNDVRIPDGSGTLRLPSDYKITGFANGAVDVAGPDGQMIDLGIACPVLTPEAIQAFVQQQLALGIRPQAPQVPVAPYTDPVKAVENLVPVLSKLGEARGELPYRLEKIVESAPLPWPNGQAANIHLIVEIGRGDHIIHQHSLATVATMPIGGGQWLYYFSQVSAPDGIFQRDLTTMIQIWASWKVDAAVLQARLQKAMETMRETHEIWRRSNEYAQRVYDRAVADFDEVIRGYRTVEDTLTGERRDADLGWVDRVVDKLNEKAGYERYKQIPLRDQ